MKQVTLIRAYVTNRLVPTLRVWISTLPETETEALQALHGKQGEITAEMIATEVLYALGHRTPSDAANDEHLNKPRPRGRPRKVPSHSETESDGARP